MMTFWILVWYIVGFTGHVYWWTSKNDFGVGDLLLGLIVSLMGPFTWFAGWMVFGNGGEFIILKKRKNNNES
jgi:hypothetical protein